MLKNRVFIHIIGIVCCGVLLLSGLSVQAIVQHRLPVADDIGGDLTDIKARGHLRILVPANLGGRYLSREGSPVETQQEIATTFAESLGLKPILIPVRHFKDMIPSLMKGHGDIIVANLTVTNKRKKQISFAVPLTQVHEQVLVRADQEGISKKRDLASYRVMADPNASFWQSLQTLKKRYSSIKLLARPKNILDEDELDLLVAGKTDAIVRDSNIASMYLGYRDDIKVAFDLGKSQDIAWGVRKDAPLLRAALNEYLLLEYLSNDKTEISKGDLDDIKKRKVLRLLVPNNAASYYLYRGKLMGFEYELAKAFAKKMKVRLEVIVPDNHNELIDLLLEGRGDIATGFLEPQESIKQRGISFSQPYHSAARQLIVHESDPLECLQKLNGRTITVRQSSAYWQTLQALQAEGFDFKLEAASENLETEELIDQVGTKQIDITVADGHLLDIERAKNINVQAALSLGEKRDHAVAVRQNNPQLLAALNDFIKKHRNGTLYNILYKKYFKNKRTIRHHAKNRAKTLTIGQLSPYDKWVKRYSERYNFDWRLITAQMYQESRFNPAAKSSAGALGLMQVMPRTAKFMGFKDVVAPSNGIHAGVKYMNWVRQRFTQNLILSERLWFTLASYNAGHGHVDDARRLAKQKGWDSNRWFDHTERAILLLSKRKYARKARYGYVRGRETSQYVRNIEQLFKAYVSLVSE